MGWILGFGIPLGYITTAIFSARVVFRSRYKRDLHKSYSDIADTGPLCTLVGMFWPVALPFFLFSTTLRGEHANTWERIFKFNLPETNNERRHRLAEERRQIELKLHKLELDCGMTPTKTMGEINRDNPRRSYDY